MVNENEILIDADPDDNLFNNYYRSMNVDRQSNYYSITNFNDSFTRDDQCFKLCNFNIRSFNANSDEFLAFLECLTLKFNVIILTETRFLEGAGRGIDGYDGYHSGRVTGLGGGVSVYCDSKLLVNYLPRLSFVNDDIELCTVGVDIGKRRIFIIALYRPPSGSIDRFNESLLSVLMNADVSNQEVIVTGDFNIDLIGYDLGSSGDKACVYNLFSLKFLPFITKPTRFPVGNQLGSPSLLDHIWYNRFVEFKSGIILFDKTDHLPNFFILNELPVSNDGLVKLVFRDRSAANLDKFTNECSRLNWNLAPGNVNLNTKYFCRIIDEF